MVLAFTRLSRQLTLETFELPVLGDREVLIENHMIAFNPVDWKLIASPDSPWKAGHIPGVEAWGLSQPSEMVYVIFE